jgi:OOP family OmpA-OmpF porin
MNLDYEVAEIRPSASFARQCIELFRTATRGRPIEFALSSAELRTSTYPVLDELIQVAADCPGTIVTVTGHTDRTGNEANNVALSEMRAQAVADYLVAGGIAAARVRAIGAGSSQPIVAGNTRRARQLNRRIELDLEFPNSRAASNSGCPQGVSPASRPSIPISSTTKTSVEPGAMTGPICRSP